MECSMPPLRLSTPPRASLALAVAVLVCLASSASAETYVVTIADVANNCKKSLLSIQPPRVSFADQGPNVSVTVGSLKTLTGTAGKSGSFKAQADQVPTSAADTTATVSASGRRENGALQMVLVAEYFQGKTPSCTQSWSISSKK